MPGVPVLTGNRQQAGCQGLTLYSEDGGGCQGLTLYLRMTLYSEDGGGCQGLTLYSEDGVDVKD